MAGDTPTQTGSPWDDTAITKSWDRVVGDYKAFQDVRARGGTVEDLPASLIDDVTEPESSPDAKPEANREIAQEAAGGVAMVADDEGATATAINKDGSVKATLANNTAAPAPSRPTHSSAQAAASSVETNGQAFSAAASNTVQLPVPGSLSPQMVLGGADESLKKLLMSWYYAGYYTGLYEGEQKAAAAAAAQQQQSLVEKATATAPADGNDMDVEAGQEISQ